MKDQIKNHIITLLSKHKTALREEVYSVNIAATIPMGDESKLETTVWTRNRLLGTDAEKVNHELDNAIIANISASKVPANWTMTEDTGLHMQFNSNWNDFVRLQITDNCIYLISLESGQY